MPKLILSCILAIASFASFSQSFKTKSINDIEYVNFELNDLVAAFEMPMAEYRSELERFKYQKNTTPDQPDVYIKEEFGKRIHAISKADMLISVDWYDFVDKTGKFDKIVSELKPNFLHRHNDIDYYSYNEYTIGIMSSSTDEFRRDTILIKRK